MPPSTQAPSQADWKNIQIKVLERAESLPSLSSVVHEFLELSRREFFTAKDFERVIIKDQALVARLLKIANSGMFGASREIRTIPEAVVLVGLENMKNMVYAVSASGLMRRDMKSYPYPDTGFWMHSIGVGITCRAICEPSRKPPLAAEEAFVAGLLHDVAKLILDDFLDPAPGQRAVSLEEERQICGLDHTELAEHILKSWHIPQPITETVRFHHDPCQDGGWHPGAALVHLADFICNTWGVGCQELMNLGEEIRPQDHGPILETLGLTEAILPQILLRVRQKMAELANYYEGS
jgi:HD-like signal output (HDOD) protein